MHYVKIALVVISVVAVFSVAGQMDLHDEVREQVLYCENVAAGVWPDFRGWDKSECAAIEKSLR